MHAAARRSMPVMMSAMSLRALGATSALAMAALSSAPDAVAAPALAPYQLRIDDGGGAYASARQLVPDAATAVPGEAALAQSRILYLNKNGVTLMPAAVNDARQNRSTIASQPTTIPPWAVDDATWTATVTCLREVFAPFAVKIVTVDPGAALHLEAVFGGAPALLGLPGNVAGVSPFTTSCSVIESSMVFVFTGVLNATPRTVCEIMAQEIAHSYGLDHEVLASDPMTYLPFSGKRWFRDELASCGEYQARPCGIGANSCRAMQNSMALLRERLGVADAVLPTGQIVAPVAGEVVDSTFTIEIAATDNIAVSEVELLLDDAPLAQLDAAPFSFTARDIVAGDHVLTAVVIDQARNTVRVSAALTVVPEPKGLLDGCQLSAAASAGDAAAVALALLGLAPRRRRARALGALGRGALGR